MEEATKEAVVDHGKRFGPWWIISLVALAWIWWKSPENGEVLTYKVAQEMVALLLAYWVIKVFLWDAPQLHPNMPRDVLSAALIVGRAIIIAGVIHGLTSGI